MNPKPVKRAYNSAFRRQFNDNGAALPPPAETHEEDRKLIMTIDGVRFIGKKVGGAFVWEEVKPEE